MAGASMTLTGDKRLQHNFAALPGRLQRNALRRGVTKAARKIVRDAKGKVPVETGTLKASLGYKMWTYRDKTGVGSVVGPRSGKQFERAVARNRRGRLKKLKRGETGEQTRKPRKYAHLAELHKPYLRPAYEANKTPTVMILGQEIRVEINKVKP